MQPQGHLDKAPAPSGLRWAKRGPPNLARDFVFVADPIGFGLINSLGRPGGNANGPSLMSFDLRGKRLELLKQAVPSLSRVARWVDTKTDPARERPIKTYEASAHSL